MRFVGVTGCLTVVAGAIQLAVAGFSSKLNALQLSGDPEQVRQIVQGGTAKATKRLERQILTDYGFIACYWLAFVALAIMVARRGGVGYRIGGLIAAIAATATGLLDLLENARTKGVLALSRPGDQVRLQPVMHLRRTSLLKWCASASTLALLSIAFLPGQSWLRLLGFALLAVAAVGFLAVLENRLILVYMGLFFVLGVVIAVWFTGWPGDVVSQL